MLILRSICTLNKSILIARTDCTKNNITKLCFIWGIIVSSLISSAIERLGCKHLQQQKGELIADVAQLKRHQRWGCGLWMRMCGTRTCGYRACAFATCTSPLVAFELCNICFWAPWFTKYSKLSMYIFHETWKYQMECAIKNESTNLWSTQNTKFNLNQVLFPFSSEHIHYLVTVTLRLHIWYTCMMISGTRILLDGFSLRFHQWCVSTLSDLIHAFE